MKSFSIAASGSRSRFWDERYIVTLSEIKSQGTSDVSSLVKFDRKMDVSGYKIINREKCDGFIDIVNGSNLSSAQISTSSLLRAEGWLAISVDKPTLPDAVFLVLIDDRGNYFFFETRRTLRPDVGAAFHKFELDNSGYIANVDVSAFAGQYTLGLAMRYLGNIEMCPRSQFTGSVINIGKSE